MRKPHTRKHIILLMAFIVLVAGGGVFWLYRTYYSKDSRTRAVINFIRDPDSLADLRVSALSSCGDAPFIMPTDGMIGYLWGDSFRPGHHHTGIDVFAGTDVGITPVYAAYDGYLTRLPDWKSTVIVRIPADPLQPDRQIWMYYTHLADSEGNSFVDAAFPPGTEDLFVTAGTLLGYQGNFSGTPGNPTGVHLHFSIVLDDGEGHFLNELAIENTLDPSPYLGLALNARENPDGIPVCQDF
ncbi:MAG TPA: hypothetical protein DF984_08210 [Anaerolineaceae bacterium]|jgi:hypothetical protein|nr:hypothetical protein [Anaerolineaceae bacterium]